MIFKCRTCDEVIGDAQEAAEHWKTVHHSKGDFFLEEAPKNGQTPM